ncbi:hypothetical protein AK36_3598 [Burkholderia vietnamiensis LMG 10929]|nr:hypothetical protein AK36_3598 [Burkholderia vietnamiensis LMG 10929]
MRFDRERFLTEARLSSEPFDVGYHSGRGVFPGWLLFVDRPVTEEVEYIHAQYIG